MPEYPIEPGMQPIPEIGHVREYAAAARLCEERRLYTTSQMLFALAIEVLLKASIKFSLRQHDYEHDLVALFKKLPEDLQEAALREFEAHCRPETHEGREPRDAFMHVLEVGKKAFVKLRYAYEHPPEHDNFVPFYDIGTVYDVLEHVLKPTFGPYWESEIAYKDLVPAHLYEED